MSTLHFPPRTKELSFCAKDAQILRKGYTNSVQMKMIMVRELKRKIFGPSEGKM